MSLKSSIQQSAYQQALKRYLRNSAVQKQAINLKQAEHLAILFDLSNNSAEQAALAYAKRLEKLNKKVHLLAYTHESYVPEGLSYPCFCKKDTNWAQVPKNEIIQEFLEQTYDILITFYLQESAPLDFILKAAQAKMVVGYHRPDWEASYDLMVHNKNQDLQLASQQLQKCLNWINH